MTYWTSNILTIALVAAFFVAAPTAAADMVCGDRQKMVDFLDRKYQESRIGMGVNMRGAVIEVFASRTGSWTLLVTIPRGPTCVISTGENWVTQLAPAPKGTDAL